MSNEGNKREQIAELKSLRQEYKAKSNQGGDNDTFEFLGPKVPDATEANPTRMEIHNPKNGLVITVTLPSDYPSEAPPHFKVEGIPSDSSEPLTKAHHDAIQELLEEQATYMPGMPCVAMCLMALDDLDLSTLDLGQPGRCRSIFKVEVVNNSKQFTKSLKAAANGNPYNYFYRTIECQNNAKFSFAIDPWRAVYCVCDAPTKKEAVAYMKTIRTDGAMDMDMLGKPGKIQLTVMEEFELASKSKAIDEGGEVGLEYRTTEDLDAMLNPFLAAVAGV